MRVLILSMLLGAAGAGGWRLYQCRNYACYALVDCEDKWEQIAKCSSGHKMKCPVRPQEPGWLRKEAP